MHGLRLRILTIHYVFIILVLNATYGSGHYHANLVRAIILVNDIFHDDWCACARKFCNSGTSFTSTDFARL